MIAGFCLGVVFMTSLLRDRVARAVGWTTAAGLALLVLQGQCG